jgi:hypothetical protein
LAGHTAVMPHYNFLHNGQSQPAAALAVNRRREVTLFFTYLAIGHLVKRMPQQTDFINAIYISAGAQIAGGHTLQTGMA